MYTFGEVIWMFLIYSVIGWVWESSYVSIKNKKMINRGFLRGPVIPIYGFAATTIMFSLKVCEEYVGSVSWENSHLIFIFAAVVASVWEYVTSFILEVLFKTRWWDYSQLKFNLKGRISLGTSLFWGLGSTLLWFFVNGKLIILYQSVPEVVMRKVLLFTYFIILVDVILTLKELVGLRKLVIKLQKTSEEMVNGLMKKIENKGDFYLLDFLNDAKANIKQKMNYRKVEQFQGFSEFLDEMTNKGKEWKLDNEILTEHFRDVLGKIKRNARFYKNYPNAKTRHFHMMFVTRKLDFIVQEIKRQLSNKD